MPWSYQLAWTGTQPDAGAVKRWLTAHVPPYTGVEVAVHRDRSEGATGGFVLINADRDPSADWPSYVPPPPVETGKDRTLALLRTLDIDAQVTTLAQARTVLKLYRRVLLGIIAVLPDVAEEP